MKQNITYEEIKKNLILWREGKNEDALIWLVKNNSKLIYFISRKYKGKGLSFDELNSAGLEGLIKAVTRFNYNYKSVNLCSFKSYIYKSIENQIITDIKNNSKHNDVVSINESIKSLYDDEEYTLEELIPSDDLDAMSQMICKMEDEYVKNALCLLSPKERNIICLRYGLEGNEILTLNEIGKLYNCSGQAISAQEQKALKKMKTAGNSTVIHELISK